MKQRHSGPSDEGSGLIDIAALADVTSDTGLSSIDPLGTPAWGGAPPAQPEKHDHRVLFAILGAVCLASLGVVAVVLFTMADRSGAVGGLERAAGAEQEARGGQPLPAPPAPAAAPEVLAAQPAPKPPQASPAAAAPVEEAKARADEPEAKSSSDDEAPQADSDGQSARERRREARRLRREQQASSLPAKPSREDVLKALGRVQSKVKSCARGESGVVTLDLRVNGPRGRVSSAKVSGLSGAAERCATSAARGARFSPFADKAFAIRYPIRL